MSNALYDQLRFPEWNRARAEVHTVNENPTEGVKGNLSPSGEGLRDWLSWLIRKGPSPKVREALKKYGQVKIKSIRACRRPLEKILRLASRIITGKIEQHLGRTGYDDLYHLYLIMVLENGQSILVDKQEVVNFKVVPADYHEPEQVCIDIPMIGNELTPAIMFENAYKIFDSEHKGQNFWLYDAFTNNCQIFVNALLKGSSPPIVYDEEAKKFVMQDVGSVVKSTDLIARVSGVLTDLGAIKDRIIHGAKLPDGGQRGTIPLPVRYSIS